MATKLISSVFSISFDDGNSNCAAIFLNSARYCSYEIIVWSTSFIAVLGDDLEQPTSINKPKISTMANCPLTFSFRVFKSGILFIYSPSHNLDSIEFLQICRNFRQNRLVFLKSLEMPADLHLFSHSLDNRSIKPADLHLLRVGWALDCGFCIG
ncbi:hypothetical protein D1872_274550 [compost metagenome]